jgi:aspartyl-tRNA(Asn)/glutamyl-tRNA(Gln) amidotransferase subunit B
MNYEATIGLEVHVQIKTASKMFCSCATEFGAPPNTNVCPVCLGYPGVLPVMNEAAVRKTVLTGLLFGCEIARFSKWDRKNYFYPDMPKNYQISQYDLPLCKGGAVEIDLGTADKSRAGQKKKIGLTRIHLEEDVAKNFHFETTSGVDFNRAGTPLMEMVSKPDIASPDEAFAYLTALREILSAAGISDCDMEKGQMRCDCNVSVRLVGQKDFGTKIEIKNMNTISGVRRALAYEIQRQAQWLNRGETLQQETRRWDDAAGVTQLMRTKEFAHDYRYFPEPDLMPVELDDAFIESVRAEITELPEQKRRRFVAHYGLSDYDAGVLVADAAVANFFEAAARVSKNPKAVCNWIANDLLRELSAAKKTLAECAIQPQHIAQLVELVDRKQISSTIGKQVFAEMFVSGKPPADIVKEKRLAQVTDARAIEKFAEDAIAANPKSVADYKAGKAAALNAILGQAMRASGGKADPQALRELLRKKLSQQP